MSDLIQLNGKNGKPRAPKPDELELRFSSDAVFELNALKGHYPDEKSCILPALWVAQREYGGILTMEAMAEVAYRLNRSYAEIEGVATFYSMYNTHHVGKHKFEVCTCLSCHVNHSYRLLEHLEFRLGIKRGETTEDGLFTIEEVECLNACDRAPVFQVGDEYIGRVTPEVIDDLIEKLKGRETSSNVQLASELVKVHLRRDERARH